MDNLDMLDLIKDRFELEEVDMRRYSPLTLAFIGDCVFDLVIRTVVVERANQAPQKLHKKKSDIVKAPTQARMAEVLADEFNAEEEDHYRRGRNAKSYTSAKNAKINDYRKATGLEAVMGYLYMTGQNDRIVDLIKKGLEKMEIEL